MTPRPIATAPKEIAAPQRLPAQTPAVSSVDFAQLLDGGLLPLRGGTSAAATAQPHPQSPQAPQAKPKTADPSADPSAAAAALAGTPLPPQQNSAPAAPTPVATAATAATQALQANAVAPLVAAAGAAPTSGTTSAGSASPSGQGKDAPLGAAELEARIVSGTPNYLSQPGTVLGGLWHHGAETPAAPAPGTDPAAPSDPSASDGKDTPAAAAKATVAAASATLVPHESGAGVAPPPPLDAGSTPGAAPASSPDQSSATAALPAIGEHQVFTVAPASPASPAAPMPGQVPIPAAAEQVALSLREAAQNGTDRIEIQLKPASLGAINVKLDVTHDGHITAVISADRSDTLNLLRQDQSGLEQALRDAGLKTDSGSLSFNLRGGDPQTYQQGAGTAPTGGGYRPSALETSPGETPLPSQLRRHDGALDIEV